MSKFNLKHGHLVIDGTKEYLDSSIIINDERIEEVYPFTDKVTIEYEGFKRINLKDSLVFPLNIELDEYEDLYQVKSHIRKIDESKKLFLTGSLRRKKINVDYDLIYDLYNDMIFDIQDEGLIEEAFYTDHYVSVDTSLVTDEQLLLAIKNIDKDKLILMNNDDTIYSRLHDLKVSNTDMYLYLTGNVLRLFDDEKLNGGLIKGKKSDLIILDTEYNVILRIIDGEIVND